MPQDFQVFRTQVKLRFHDADPAGIMYFGRLPSLAHDCFEEFIQAAGWSWAEWFQTKSALIPIRHLETDFLSPFRPGLSYDVDVTVARLGETSFQMRYVFHREGARHAVVKMVHANLDPKNFQKKPLSEELRSRLAPYVAPEPA